MRNNHGSGDTHAGARHGYAMEARVGDHVTQQDSQEGPVYYSPPQYVQSHQRPQPPQQPQPHLRHGPTVPLSVDTGFYHAEVLSPGRGRAMSLDPTLLSPSHRLSGSASLPLRSPKRTISFDFPPDMPQEMVEEFHRHFLSLASAAGAGQSVKVVEESAPEEDEEEQIPFIQLQAPPKAKFKRQLSADNSPPQQSQTSRHLCLPGARHDECADQLNLSQMAAEDASTSQMNIVNPLGHADTATVNATLNTTVNTTANSASVRGHKGVKVLSPTPDGSPVITALSRSAPAADSGQMMTSSMSPKRLKSEYGSIPCTPNKSPPATPAHAAALNPSKPRSGKRCKNPDIVFIFPELHPDQFETDEESDDENNNNNGNSKHQAPGRMESSGQSTHKADDETDSLSIGSELADSSPSFAMSHTRPDTAAPHSAASVADKEKMQESNQLPKDSRSPGSLQMLQMLMRTKQHTNTGPASSLSHARSLTALDAKARVQRPYDRQPSDIVRIFPTAQDTPEARGRTTNTSTHIASRHLEYEQARPAEATAPCARYAADSNVFLVRRLQAMQEKLLGEQDSARPASAAYKELTSTAASHPQAAHEPSPSWGTMHRDHQQLTTATDDPQDAGRVNRSGSLGSREQVRKATVSQPDHTHSVMFHSTSAPNLNTEAAESELLTYEEESRTARLCRSKENPFTFTEKEIEQAQKVLTKPGAQVSSMKSETQIVRVPFTESSGKVSDVGTAYTPSVIPDQTSQSPWTSRHESAVPGARPAWSKPTDTPMKHRQISDPGILNLYHQPPEPCRIDTAPTRQFSEPGCTASNQRAPATAETRGFEDRHPDELFSYYKEPMSDMSQLKNSRFRGQATPQRERSPEGDPRHTGRSPHFHSTYTRFSQTTEQSDEHYQFPVPVSSSPRKGNGNLKSNIRRTDSFDANASLVVPELEARDCDFGGHEARTSEGRNPQDPFSQLSPSRSCLSSNPLLTLPGQCRQAAGYLRTPDDFRNPENRGTFPDKEDDTVFEENLRESFSYPVATFKSPSLSPHQLRQMHSASRMGTSDHRTPTSDTIPKRPALRSQSNVEQSPNQAELDEMAHHKFLRSYSEHLSDPARLMKQLKVMSPTLYARVVGGLQQSAAPSATYSRGTSSSLPQDPYRHHRDDTSPGSARRRLFVSTDQDVGDWPQTLEHHPTDHVDLGWPYGSHTFPPAPLRRQSLASGRPLRHAVSWHRDREGRGEGRNREPGDIDVRIQCTNAVPADGAASLDLQGQGQGQGQPPEVLRRKIETYIHQILQSHLQQRPQEPSQAEMAQWVEQYREIQKLTQEAERLISRLSEHNRSVYDVTTGSVVIGVNCPTLASVLDLWELFRAGALQGMVGEIFGGEKLRRLTGLCSVGLQVTMRHSQYKACLDELVAAHVTGTRSAEVKQQMVYSPAAKVSPLSKREIRSAENLLQIGTPPRSPLAAVHGRSQSAQELMTSSPLSSPCWSTRSPSSPNKRERKFSYGDNSARKAFSELNLSDGETPTSPTKRRSFFGSSEKENAMLSPLNTQREHAAPPPFNDQNDSVVSPVNTQRENTVLRPLSTQKENASFSYFTA